MTAKTADEIRGELDERYARFCLRPLTDGDVWALGMATMVMPDGNPGAEAYLAQVSGTVLFGPRLAMWGRVVALGIASAAYKAPNGARRRAYVEGYDESWGRYAVADGLGLVLCGKAEDALGHAAQNRQGYIRIRDFVGGALVCAIEEFRVALEWATGYRRDRVLAGRWEGITGLNYRDVAADASMGRESCNYPMFAPGCSKVPQLADVDDRLKPRQVGKEPKDPETLYRSLRPTAWWDANYARRMRDAPVETSFPRHGTICPAAE